MKHTIILTLFLLSPVTHAEENEWWQYYDRDKTIHLQFVNEIKKGYTASVTWTPDGGMVPMLSGPALIHFKSDRWRDSFTIMTDYFHVSLEVLEQAGLKILNDDYEDYNLQVDLDRTYPIKYTPYKKISLWCNPPKN